MRVIVANGTQDADYLINLFKKEKDLVSAINHDPFWAKYIASHNNIDVYYGDPTKKYVQTAAHVDKADLFIGLCDNDIENFVACKVALEIFHVKKAVCIVSNPQYAPIFSKLGIDGVVSSTQILAQKIFAEASFNSISNVLSLENDKLSITDMFLPENSQFSGKQLKDIKFPVKASICAIYRDPDIIIPNGLTKLLPGDKILFVSSTEDSNKVVDFLTK